MKGRRLTEAVAAEQQQAWYQLAPGETAQQLDVDVAKGLSAAEAQRRLQQYGPNHLAGKQKESGVHAFLRQYQDFMQIILETQTMFTRDILEDRRQLYLYGMVVLLTFLVTQVGFMQRIFHTTALTAGQWLLCIGVAATLIVVAEVIKFFLRRGQRQGHAQSQAPASVTRSSATDDQGLAHAG